MIIKCLKKREPNGQEWMTGRKMIRRIIKLSEIKWKMSMSEKCHWVKMSKITGERDDQSKKTRERNDREQNDGEQNYRAKNDRESHDREWNDREQNDWEPNDQDCDKPAYITCKVVEIFFKFWHHFSLFLQLWTYVPPCPWRELN